jgi:hypothetical protein
MGSYVGLTLAGGEWCFALLEVGRDSATREHRQSVPLPQGVSSQMIWKSLEQVTGLQAYIPTGTSGSVPVINNEVDVCKNVAQVIRRTALLRYFKQYVVEESVDTIGTVGIAHPYGITPTARRALPALIDGDVIEIRRADRNERRAKGSGMAERACAVEAPFAACLELLGDRGVCPPAWIAVLGDSSCGIEATLISAVADEQTWKLSVKAYRAGTKDEISDWLPPVLDRLQGSQTMDVILACLEGFNDSTLVKSMSDCGLRVSVQELAGADFAAGAARYAALCSGENVSSIIPGNRVRQLECASIAPHAIGVCGHDGAGETLWCPLYEVGEPLTGGHRRVRFEKGPIPPRLILAECLRQDRCPGEWIGESKQLRWYAEVPVSVPPDTREGIVDLTIESSTDCWAYGWSDPFISSSFAAVAD